MNSTMSSRKPEDHENEDGVATTQVGCVVPSELMAAIDLKINEGSLKNRSVAIRKGLELLLQARIDQKPKTNFEQVMIAAKAFVAARDDCVSGSCKDCPLFESCKESKDPLETIDEFYSKIKALAKDDELQKILAALKKLEG